MPGLGKSCDAFKSKNRFKKTLNAVLDLREIFTVYMSMATLTLIVSRALASVYSRTPLIRPPSESHWCGRIRGMVAREGFVYEQKPLSVTRYVVV